MQNSGGGTTRHMEAQRNFAETPQGLDKKSKMEVVQTRQAGKARILDNSGGELDPAVDDRRRYKKNFPSFLSCFSNGIRECCDCGPCGVNELVRSTDKTSSFVEIEDIWQKGDL